MEEDTFEGSPRPMGVFEVGEEEFHKISWRALRRLGGGPDEDKMKNERALESFI